MCFNGSFTNVDIYIYPIACPCHALIFCPRPFRSTGHSMSYIDPRILRCFDTVFGKESCGCILSLGKAYIFVRARDMAYLSRLRTFDGILCHFCLHIRVEN